MSKQIQVKVKCFSFVRYALGKSEIIVNLPEGTSTNEIEKKVREMAGNKLDRISLRVAVNQTFVLESVKLKDGDEVALIPPIQGG